MNLNIESPNSKRSSVKAGGGTEVGSLSTILIHRLAKKVNSCRQNVMRNAMGKYRVLCKYTLQDLTCSRGLGRSPGGSGT